MKILILTAYYPPLGASGHDERCRQVVDALSARGHRLQVLTSNHRMPPMGVFGENQVFRQFQLHDVTDEESVLGVSYKATVEYELANARALYCRLDRFKADVVYVWNMNGLSKSLLMSLQEQGAVMVYDLHSRWLSPNAFELDPWYRWWRRNDRLRSKCYQAYLKMTGVARRRFRYLPVREANDLDLSNSTISSQSLRDHLVATGLTQAETLPVMHPALDTSRLLSKISFQPVRKFMWAGRLIADKAPATALRAMSVLKERGVHVSLDFYGMGKPIERRTIRNLIDSSGLSDSVRMLGIRPGELIQKYKDYDALLFTSYSDDPFPMTPLEAMLSRLPCVLARDGGIQEVVEDGETAFLYTPGDAESLADAMVRMMELPDHGDSMSKKCLERLQAQHSLGRVVGQIEALLLAAIQR